MTDKVLLDNGYREYEVPSTEPYVNRFFQKKIKDDKGTKYYIDVYEYEFQHGFDYEFELCTSKPKFHVKTLLYGLGAMTIEEIEKEIEDIWQKCKFDYYELIGE